MSVSFASSMKNLSLALLLTSSLVSTAQAATLTWDGGAGTSNWFDANNWSGNAVPTSADQVRLDASGVVVSILAANSGTLFAIGYSGTGSLTVENSGTIFSTPATTQVIVGNSSGSNGTLFITSGGTVSDVVGSIGNYAGATGVATVTGVGSSWVNSGSFFVGYGYGGSGGGSGSLTVTDGGVVRDSNGYIGGAANSIGAVTVTGSGSSWISSNFLAIGNGGYGTLTVEDGGLVSTTSSSAQFLVGNAAGSQGTLLIQNGGVVNNLGWASIGNYAGATGAATVTGVGSIWTNQGSLNVGYSYSGAGGRGS